MSPLTPAAVNLDPARSVLQITDRLLRVELLTEHGAPIAMSPSGHVPLTAGTVYQIAITNRSPRRGVAHVWLDGTAITENGLVVPAFGRVVLQRCVSDVDRGRFTVRPEGDTAAFGPDGGRSNGDLGRIQVRLDLERAPSRPLPTPSWPWQTPSMPTPWPQPTPYQPWLTGPIWIGGHTTGGQLADATGPFDAAPMHQTIRRARLHTTNQVQPTLDAEPVFGTPLAEPAPTLDTMRAAGTALTGESHQRFHTIHVGPCDVNQGEVILRLVIGAPLPVPPVRPLPRAAAPVRPAAQP